MAEHPDVTVTPAQYRQLEPFFPYQYTPELNALMVAWSAILLQTAVVLVQLDTTEQRARALANLEEASVWTQQALIRGKGIPYPPPWLHIEPPPEDTP